MSGPWACDDCLRRAWLVGHLAPAIDRALEGRPGSRARELLALPDAELAAAVAAPSAPPPGLIPSEPALMRTAIREARCWACCRHDGAYPARLMELGDAPAALFCRGSRRLLTALDEAAAVTVVGTRRPSAYGRELAKRLAGELAAAGLLVVSGMALGIDSCAHDGALEARGRTVAVLGGGPETASPASARRLYESIAAEGLVLSELPPGTTPRRWSFPARNRIMAALSAMTVVVEARVRSGSLITATMAADLGREVGAVPGLVGSSAAAGVNSLLRDGAQVVRGGQDVIDSLLGAGAGVEAAIDASSPVADLPPDLAAALDLVEQGAASADAVARAGGLSPDAAAGALVRLELEGLVRSDSLGRYRPSRGV